MTFADGEGRKARKEGEQDEQERGWRLGGVGTGQR